MKNYSIRDKIKLIPGVSLGAGIYRWLYFIKRVIRLRNVITKIDRQSPFKGKLSELGYYKFEISKKCQTDLLDLYKYHNTHSKSGLLNIHLSTKEKKIIEEIFNKLQPEITNYLGEKACLDGINWMVSDSTIPSVSASWHTDNVGNRIKVFICIIGDGSQPTVIVPSKSRIPNFYSWLRNSLQESLRWFGINNIKKFYNEIKLNHKNGTMYAFDTQLLHRGSYNTAISKRVIFHMEFSIPEKHLLSRGPIGTEDFNSFTFTSQIYSIKSFKKMLDANRINHNRNKFFYRRR